MDTAVSFHAVSTNQPQSTYVCILANTNQTPPNATFWTVLAGVGTAATVSVGTTSTGAGGSAAAVTNSGTSGAAVLNFTIPQGKSYACTSATSFTIGTGSKAFTTQAGLAWLPGARARISSLAGGGANYMEGVVTSYSGTTLTVNVSKVSGSGTDADWQISLAGDPGSGDLLSTNNLSDLANAVTARKNLGIPAIMRSYLAGLTLSTAGASTTFGIAAGVAANSSNVDIMSLATAYTKTTAVWAVGTAAGSLDTGTIANSTWYHVFLIKRTDTGVVDVLISLSATAPTLPTSYTLFRRVGSMKTNGSAQWTLFHQYGDVFRWAQAVQDAAVVGQGTSAVTVVLTVPRGIQLQADIVVAAAAIASASILTLITSLDETDRAPSGSDFTLDVAGPAAGIQISAPVANLFTNTSAQIRTRWNSALGDALLINTFGWFDRRGRDA